MVRVNNKIRAHLLISGRVQGVYFREKTKLKAREWDVSGWVRNLPNGMVEAVFEGDKDRVEKVIDWAKHGPFWAKVKNVDIEWQEYRGEFQKFEVKYNSCI